MADQASFDFEPNYDELRPAAERALAAAQDLTRSNDPGAEGAFLEAENLAVRCADQEIQMRAFEASGRFHEGRGAFRTAHDKYRTALSNAKCLTVVSDAAVEREARLRWDLVRMENRDDSAFKNLLRASKPDDSLDRLRKTWDQFIGERANSQGRRAARGIGSVEYFRTLIDATSLDPDDDE